MKVLAIDTSSDICSVAVIEDYKILKELHNKSEKEHSQTLMPMIKQILEELQLTLDDIELLACGVGPGSFTGIRIGIATVKAFSDSRNIPIIGINSIEAMAYGVMLKVTEQKNSDLKETSISNKQSFKVLPMIDARNENVYFGIYRFKNESMSIYKNIQVMNINDTVEFMNFDDTLYITGYEDGESKLEPYIKAKIAKNQAECKQTEKYKYIKELPTMAEAIGIAALDKYKLKLFGNSDTIAPIYLRKPQAERQREGNSDEKIHILEMVSLDFENIKENYQKFDNLWNLQTFEEDCKASNYLVAKQNNEVVGFISTKIVLDELEIVNIVTRNEKRKQGIASDLLSYIIRKNKVSKINLEVNEHNTTAMNLYKKFGFREVGLRKKYYQNKDDAILMTLDLK